jgi:hypothetical protein
MNTFGGQCATLVNSRSSGIRPSPANAVEHGFHDRQYSRADTRFLETANNDRLFDTVRTPERQTTEVRGRKRYSVHMWIRDETVMVRRLFYLWANTYHFW